MATSNRYHHLKFTAVYGHDLFSHHDIKVLDKDAGCYEITLHYTNHLNLDEQLQGIANEAESIADYRNGFIEFGVYTLDGDKVWPFSH